MRARLVGAQANHDHTGRLTGEGLTGIGHPPAGIARALNALGKIQLAAVIRKGFMRRLFNEHVAEGLVKPVIVFVADPHCIGIELNTLSGHPAKEHGTKTPVADRVGFQFPVGCGFIAPEHPIRPGRPQVRIRVRKGTQGSKAKDRERHP